MVTGAVQNGPSALQQGPGRLEVWGKDMVVGGRKWRSRVV